jgi:hypothetical protein
MHELSLDAQAREHLECAAAGSAGRSAVTVYGGHEHNLRQTLLALTAGTSLERTVDRATARHRDRARTAHALHRWGVRPRCLVTGGDDVPIGFYAG